jgi:glycosyltransferase involved in cell wall biosynthesis
MPDSPRISIVVPVHNEQDDVAELAKRLEQTLGGSYEIIFIDDGSTDDTWRRLVELHEPGRIRLVRFRRNFGKTAALRAGFSLTRGEIVFTMDGDLQDDPREIPRFLEQLEQGYDLVTGWKKKRHDPAHKVAASRLFNQVVRLTTGLSLHDINCGFKAFRGGLARSLEIYGEQHRFLPVLAAARGYRVGEIEVEHHARVHGRSKYGFSRLFKGFFDLVTVLLITRFAERPSHAFGFAALACGGAAALCSLAALLLPYAWLWWKAAVLWVGVIVLLAAGWVAEVAVYNAPASRRPSAGLIEEQLD